MATKYVPLTGISLNTHRGASLRNGTLAELLDEHWCHWLALQEVRRRDLDDLRRVLGDEWHVFGAPDSVVCLRKVRFRHPVSSCEDNTLGGKHERTATYAGAYDRRARRWVDLQSVHVQPLGRGLVRASRGARRRQRRQLRVFRNRSALAGPQRVVIDAGDFNQDLDVKPRNLPAAIRPFSAHTLWSNARMRMVAGRNLDGVFVRFNRYVKVRNTRVIETTGRGDNHPAVLVELNVRVMP